MSLTDQLMAAWQDYWGRPDLTPTEIAAKHKLNYGGMHKGWERRGLTRRRNGCTVGAMPDDPPCAGVSVVFCSHCTACVTCYEWHCDVCPKTSICPCHHEELRPADWATKFAAFCQQRDRNARAVMAYEYAWADPYAMSQRLHE